MLYALGTPAAFAELVASFLVAATLHGWVQSRAAARAGERTALAGGRGQPDPRRQLDPFGTVAAVVAGIGWARQTELDRRRPGLVAVLLSGTVANLLVAVAALVGARALGRPAVGSLLDLQRGTADAASAGGALYLLGLSNLAVGLLSLVPLPPLPGGRLLLARAPRTPAWQKAEYRLVEQNLGTVVLLVLLLVPLGGPQPLLPTLLDLVVQPLLRPLAGG